MNGQQTHTVRQTWEIARVCHEANRAFQGNLGEKQSEHWERAAVNEQESCFAGVRATLSGLATTPEEQHEHWMADKIAAGWTYGPEKDAVAKTHPCLVPYNELPEAQRRKDHLFRAIVLALTEPI